MKVLAEIEKDALELSWEDKRVLCEKLQQSLTPEGLPNADDFQATIEARKAAMESDPMHRISLDDFFAKRGWSK